MFATYLLYFFCAEILSLLIIILEVTLFPKSNNSVLFFVLILNIVHMFEMLYFYLYTYVIK